MPRKKNYINQCYYRQSLRSKNTEDPYLSLDLGILKNSVPNFIKNNPELMNKIKSINFDEVMSKNKGSFKIHLKKKKLYEKF